MKLYYSYTRMSNFGDALNPRIFGRLFGDILDDDASALLVGIGTILNHRVPKEPHKYVFGSGLGYGAPPDLGDGRWTVYCVRGPVTAAGLGLPSELAICDPALLIRDDPLAQGAEQDARSHGIAFMPHFESFLCGAWPDVAKAAGVMLIDPRGTIDEIVATIQKSRVVISEAMHGVIVADALRIPWIAAEPLIAKHRVKWQDWAQALAVDLRFVRLGPSTVAEARRAREMRLRGVLRRILQSFSFTRERFLDLSPQTEDASFHKGAKAQRRSEVAEHTTHPRDGAFLEGAATALEAAARQEPQLSDETISERAYQRLCEAVMQFRREHSLDGDSL